MNVHISCILFHFYIKPQPRLPLLPILHVVSYSISTSNHNILPAIPEPLYVVSYSISTSNHNIIMLSPKVTIVVSYSISTSNHNMSFRFPSKVAVVSYSISTSNHNSLQCANNISTLYLIPFLHQTTTATC